MICCFHKEFAQSLLAVVIIILFCGCETASDTNTAGTAVKSVSLLGVARGANPIWGGVIGLIGEGIQNEAQIQAEEDAANRAIEKQNQSGEPPARTRKLISRKPGMVEHILYEPPLGHVLTAVCKTATGFEDNNWLGSVDFKGVTDRWTTQDQFRVYVVYNPKEISPRSFLVEIRNNQGKCVWSGENNHVEWVGTTFAPGALPAGKYVISIISENIEQTQVRFEILDSDSNADDSEKPRPAPVSRSKRNEI